MSEKILFLPGTLCDQRLWQLCNWNFGPDYTDEHILLDRQNTLEAMSDVLYEKSNGQPLHLAGFSMGGYVALHFACQHPELVKSLVILAVSARGLTDHEVRLRKKYKAFLENVPYTQMTENRLAELIHPTHLTNQNIIKIIRQMEKYLGPEVLYNQFCALTERPDYMAQLQHITCPTLLISAEQDKIVANTDMRKMAEVINDCQIINIPDCGHMIPLEQPTTVSDAINNWYQNL